MALISAALEQAEADDLERCPPADSLEEALFAYVTAGLRRLEPYRTAVGPIVDSGLSPFAANHDSAGAQIRNAHLETVVRLVTSSPGRTTPSLVAMHLYWSLYVGVLAFWSRDDSPHQEDTLALLDQSLRLFVASLDHDPNSKEVSRGT
jgi:hypothetical protein